MRLDLPTWSLGYFTGMSTVILVSDAAFEYRFTALACIVLGLVAWLILGHANAKDGGT